MRIVHLVPRFFPEIGGVEKHVANISKLMNSQGDKVSVVTLEPQSESSELPKKFSQIDIYRISASDPQKKFFYKISIWRGLFAHWELLSKADVIQVHDVFWWVLPFWPLLRKKIFLTLHGHETEYPRWNHRLWHLIGHLLSRGSLAIGPVQERWYGVKSDQISFGAVDSLLDQKPHIARDNRKLRIMYLGRLNSDLGILQYLSALQIVRDQTTPIFGHDSFHLDVYGQGSDRLAAERYVDQHKLPVSFRGEVIEAARLIPNYDLVFASSYLAILEALSAGKQVIAYYGSPLKRTYLLEGTPFAEWIMTFQTRDDFLKLVSSDQMHSLNQEAVHWARQQTWEKLAQQYRTLWEK